MQKSIYQIGKRSVLCKTANFPKLVKAHVELRCQQLLQLHGINIDLPINEQLKEKKLHLVKESNRQKTIYAVHDRVTDERLSYFTFNKNYSRFTIGASCDMEAIVTPVQQENVPM